MVFRPPPSSTERCIKLLVVDDHGLVRDAVRALLEREKDFDVVGTAPNGDEAISRALETHPDIVLMDIDMPGVSCFDAIQIIRSRAAGTRFVLVTAIESDEYIEQALRAKASGFVLKSDGIDELARAIRAVAAGRVHFSPDVMNRLVIKGGEIRLDNPPRSRLGTISPRERELLRLLAQGLSLKEAASVLSISYKTADKQKASLMSKLDIHDRVELARFAIREGLVKP